MTNQNNMGFINGRLARDPKVFENSDGSKSVRLTIMAQNNYKSKDGTRGVTAIPVEGYVKPNHSLGVYEHMHKGDLIGCEYTVTANNYTDKDGNAVYGINLLVQGIDLRESKSVTDARAAKNATAEADADGDFISEETDVPFTE